VSDDKKHKTRPEDVLAVKPRHKDWTVKGGAFTAAEVVVAAKSALLSKHPFFGALTTAMREVPDPSTPTIGVSSSDTLYYNPEFMLGLSAPEAMGVMAHEVMHVALKHMLRQPKFDKLWNIAADLVINAVLLKSNLKLPEGGVFPSGDDSFEFQADEARCAKHVFPAWASWELKEGSAAPVVTIANCCARHMEEVHRLFTAVCKTSGGGEGEGGGGGQGEAGKDAGAGSGPPGKPIDSHEWNPPKTDAERARQERGVNMRVAQAVDAAKRKGSLPGGLDMVLTSLTEPKVRWQDVLRNYMSDALSDNQTWARPGLSSFGLGMYMPGKARDGGIECVIHVDTSGSCFAQAPEFLSEAMGIVRDANATGWLIMCDAAVSGEWDLEGLDGGFGMPNPKGGGGTSHQPVVDWILERAPECKLLVTLTDGCSDIPEALPRLGRQTQCVIALPADCMRMEPALSRFGTVLPIEPDAC
jgi:predicted metal-dependent peptidase